MIRFIVGLVILGYASYSDMKTRMVCDKAWIIIAVSGFIILFIQLFIENVSWLYYVTFIPIGALFLSFFAEGSNKTNLQEGKINRFLLYPIYIIGVICLIFVIYSFKPFAKTPDILFLTIMEIPAVMLLIYVLYYFRLIFGGADAKALIAMSILFPFYPSPIFNIFGYSQLKIIWPYTLVILTNGALTAIVIPISYFFYNLITDLKNIRFPVCFLGYREDIYRVKGRFLWPLEVIDNNKKRYILFQKRDINVNEQIDTLIAYGEKKIWVTHKIPFMIPLLMGFITAFLVGDILNYLVNNVILH